MYVCVRTCLKPVEAPFVFITSDIVFNPSASATTDHSQSVKDKDPSFKSQFYVAKPYHRKPVLILLNGLSMHGERAHDRDKFLFALGGIRPHILLIDSLASYRWAITALLQFNIVT